MIANPGGATKLILMVAAQSCSGSCGRDGPAANRGAWQLRVTWYTPRACVIHVLCCFESYFVLPALEFSHSHRRWTAPPKARFTAKAEMQEYVLMQRTLVIRHSDGDRIVALIEILSPGNKASRHALRSFVEKAAAALARGYHLLLIDLLPPGPRDPNGIHGALWSEICDDSYVAPRDEPRAVEVRDLRARDDAGVDAYARPARLPVGRDPPRAGTEAGGHVLRVDAALDRVARDPDVLLAQP